MKIRVLLAEDQTMVRGALAALLALEDDLEVVAEVARGDLVAAAVVRAAPDVALLDIEMPGRDGLSVAADLRRDHPAVRVLIVTTFGRPGYLRRAMEAGAHGFLLKDAPAEDLAVAIRQVMGGLQVIDAQLAADALRDGTSPLTARESEVLAASADGASVEAVAARVHLSRGTARNHLSSAIQKLGVQNRVEAVRLARDKGWLGPT
jgi:two-component system response regulator DesR